MRASAVVIGPKLADTLARGRQSDLARFLATLKTFHETFGSVPPDWQSASNVPVPIEIIELCGRLLAGRPEWVAAQAEAKREVATEQHNVWQDQANAIWGRPGNRRLSKAAVALMIDSERWDWIRRVIKK